MATTTATITLSSDIADNSFSVSNSTALTKAGSTTGLDQTSGLRRRTLAATDTVKLIDLDYYQDQTITEDKAAKVYIKNTGTSTAQHVAVGIQNGAGALEEIGWLYGGDWMFIPWSQADAAANLEVKAPNEVNTVEYAIFHEGRTFTGA